jgi:GT2 family glycosyltransferase
MSTSLVRAVLVNWNTTDLTVGCVRSLLATEPLGDQLSVLVVDNASADVDDLAQRLADLDDPRVELLRNSTNLGFAEACNRGMRRPGAQFVALINTDAVVDPGWLEPLVEALQGDPTLGAAVPLLLLSERYVDVALPEGFSPSRLSTTLDGESVRIDLNPRREPRHLMVPANDAVPRTLCISQPGQTEQRCVVQGPGTQRVNARGVKLTRFLEGEEVDLGAVYQPGASDQPSRRCDPVEVFGFCGGAVLLRAALLAEIGYFDPRFFAYFEDVDLSWRARLAGWRIAAVDRSVVHHLRHGSGAVHSPFFVFVDNRNWIVMVLRNGRPAEIVRMLVGAVLRTAIAVVRGHGLQGERRGEWWPIWRAALAEARRDRHRTEPPGMTQTDDVWDRFMPDPAGRRS